MGDQQLGAPMELTKWKIDRTEKGRGRNGLILLDGESDRVVSLAKTAGGEIVFMEECDGFFGVTMSKQDAKQALREAIAWIG